MSGDGRQHTRMSGDGGKASSTECAFGRADRVGKTELPASDRLRQFARRVQSTADNTTAFKEHNILETIQPGKRPGLDSLDSQPLIALQLQFFQIFQTEKGVGLKAP